MKDGLDTTMMVLEVGTKALHSSSNEPAWETGPIPTSALKESRGNRSQVEIARTAGISQGFLSELESGRKRLTPRVARKLAPALGMPANQILIAEHLASLKRIAKKGAWTSARFSPRRRGSPRSCLKVRSVMPSWTQCSGS